MYYREPLKLLGYIDSPNSYPAQFSEDSQSVVVVSSALSYDRWAIRDGQNLERKQLPIRDGCVSAQLSPDGALLACYRPDFTLGVLQLSTGQWIFSDLIHDWNKRLTVFPIPLDVDTPFAAPFGFRLAHDLKPLANHGITGLLLAFSPSGSLLIAGDVRDAVLVDLQAPSKTNLPSAIRKCMGNTVAIQNETRVLVIPDEKPQEPSIRSLSNGAVLSLPNFRADSETDPEPDRRAFLVRRRLMVRCGIQGTNQPALAAFFQFFQSPFKLRQHEPPVFRHVGDADLPILDRVRFIS